MTTTDDIVVVVAAAANEADVAAVAVVETANWIHTSSRRSSFPVASRRRQQPTRTRMTA